jgi:predicted O-methyltransferase YrrM
MDFARKLNALRALPRQQALAKLRDGVMNRAAFLIPQVFFSTIGYVINSTQCRLRIDYKPDSHLYFNHIQDYPDLFRRWIAHNEANNGGDLSRFYMLYQNVERALADGVQGDIVELGVYKGNSAAVLAQLARRFDRCLYLFDTFTGFDNRDLGGSDAYSRLFTDTSLEKVRRVVGGEKVTYVKGYFPESLREVALPQKIAVAHLDCDLYVPTKHGLEKFYPLVAPGGIMVLHDYSSGYWPGVRQAADEFFSERPEKPILIPDKSGSAIFLKHGF